MPKDYNEKKITQSKDSSNDRMDRSPIDNLLNSDNAFSDSGLENDNLLSEALNKGKSK
jgi:hypothetical protein